MPKPGLPSPAIEETGQVPDTMQAALFYEPSVVRYEQTPVPHPGPGELLVRVQSALTCGTDVKCYRRGHPVLLKRFPSPFGHEFAGTVAALGEGVTRFEVGDRVVAANSAPCYACYYCQKGQHNLCETLDLLNGAYADFILVPARIARHNTYRIPEHLPFEAAAFAEPLAVCLRGLEQAGVVRGDRVAVMGLGPIGQLMVRAARWQGAHVSAMARNERKLKLAREFGQADQLIDMTEYADPQAVKAAFTPDGRGFDVVIEAIGQPSTWELAVQLVRRGGTVNLFGGCPGDTTVTLPTRPLHYDEIKLVSSFHHTPTHFQQAVELIARGEIDPTPLITDIYPMARFEAALQRVEAGEAMKIALKPGLEADL